MKIARSAHDGVAKLMQDSGESTDSIRASATFRTRPAFIVPAAFVDLGLGQILNTSDPFGHVSDVGARLRHADVLQQGLFAGFIDIFGLSPLAKTL